MNSKLKKLLVSLFTTVFLSLTCSVVFGTISIDSSKTDTFKSPQGSQAVMYYFKLSAEEQEETLKSITFTNTGEFVNFGDGITGVQVYQDSDEDFKFDGSSDNSIGQLTPNEGGKWVISATESIASGNSKGFFIIYEVAEDAEIDSDTNIDVLAITAESGASADLSGEDTSNSIVITGLKTITAVSIAPDVVLPGQEKAAMLYLTITVGGELIENNIAIRIENDMNNFVMDENSTDGVVQAYLYQDLVGDGLFDPEDSDNYPRVLTVRAGEFSSTSSILFEPTSQQLSFAEDSPVNLFVVYDIGEDFEVESDSQVMAQMTSFVGTGAQSGLDIVNSEFLPSDPADPFVAGLGYGSVESIVPDEITFGQRTVAPMLGFSLFSFHTDSDLSTVTIGNDGSVPFITTPGGADGVTDVHVFEDSNGNGGYDGQDGGDTLVGTLELGDTSQNQSDTAHIPLPLGVSMETFDSDTDYPLNNEKRFFVTYTIGDRITAQNIVSGNTTSYVNSFLEDVVASANISAGTIQISLSGTLPVEANPEATLSLDNTNVSIVNVLDVSPSDVVQGQSKVPMLYLNLWSDENVASATLTILNEKGSFLDNSRGVSKVWLFRDDGDFSFTESDPEVAASSLPESVDFSTLSNVELFSGSNLFFVCYDIGQIADVSQEDGIRAQISNMASDDPPVVLGGVVPAPSIASRVSVMEKRLSIPEVVAEIDSVSTTFSVEINVENLYSEDVSLTSVSPRFYLSGASGNDISYEFSATLSDLLLTFPLTLVPGETKTFRFIVNHDSQISEGTAFLDGFVEYAISSTQNAVLTRYHGDSSWFLATDSGSQIVIQSDSEVYDWSLPDYIDYIQVKSGGEFRTFQNFDAITASSIMNLVFKNEGRAIDESSIVVKLNGVVLERNNNPAPSSYGYFRDDGSLQIWDVGSENGYVDIELYDLEGESLTPAKLEFTVSDTMEITQLYVYPSPYTVGETDMIVGFNASQPGDFTIYFFNFLGQMVFSQDEVTNETGGYVEVRIDKFEEFLQSGMFICKVIGTDRNGNSNGTITKFAVY
ncbi:hypothetical protein HOG98_01275 [bacterium]|jgi:hypothetical protein|nr:hypothetical protein [bacterium]